MADKKIQSEHLRLIEDLSMMRLKQEAMAGIHEILSDIQSELYTMGQGYHDQLLFPLPEDGGKISRGENYRGLPYQILDYPRSFHGEDVFAFRTMFLWGNFFSFSFQLSGKYFEASRAVLAGRIGELKNKDYYFCVNASPWEYQYGEENYRTLDEFLKATGEEMFSGRDFIKISRKIELKRWEDAKTQACATFNDCMALIRGLGAK